MTRYLYFFLCYCSFISSTLAQSVFVPDFFSDKSAELNEEVYVVFGHSTKRWDYSRMSEQGSRELLQFAQTNAITTIASVHEAATQREEVAQEYFVKNSEVDNVLLSSGGQHKLNFTHANKIYLAGGNLSLCLCETIRDIVGRMDWSQRTTLQLVLVKDALYDWKFWPLDLEKLDKFFNYFFLPNFHCPSQGVNRGPKVDLAGVKLSVYFDGLHFRDYPLSKTGGPATKSVVLKFLDSKDLENDHTKSSTIF